MIARGEPARAFVARPVGPQSTRSEIAQAGNGQVTETAELMPATHDDPLRWSR